MPGPPTPHCRTPAGDCPALSPSPRVASQASRRTAKHFVCPPPSPHLFLPRAGHLDAGQPLVVLYGCAAPVPNLSAAVLWRRAAAVPAGAFRRLPPPAELGGRRAPRPNPPRPTPPTQLSPARAAHKTPTALSTVSTHAGTSPNYRHVHAALARPQGIGTPPLHWHVPQALAHSQRTPRTHAAPTASPGGPCCAAAHKPPTAHRIHSRWHVPKALTRPHNAGTSPQRWHSPDARRGSPPHPPPSLRAQPPRPPHPGGSRQRCPGPTRTGPGVPRIRTGPAPGRPLFRVQAGVAAGASAPAAPARIQTAGARAAGDAPRALPAGSRPGSALFNRGVQGP